MKIQGSSISNIGLDTTPEASTLSPLSPAEVLEQDVVERFQQMLTQFSSLLNDSSTNTALPSMPTVQDSDLQKQLQDRITQSYISGPGAPDTSSTEASGGLGQTLEEAAENGINKGAHKLGTVKDPWKPVDYSIQDDFHDGDKKSGNTGQNLSSLGGKSGTAFLEGQWTALKFGEIDQSAEGDWGSAWIKGQSHILDIQGNLFYDVGFKDWTASVKVGAQGRVELVGHHYEVGYKTPGIDLAGHNIDLTTKVNLDAYIGAQGKAEAGISLGKNTSVELGAGGFTGASATLAAQESLGDFGSVGATGTAWAGVGAKWDMDAGFKDGKVDFHWGIGLALGIGLEYDINFSVDFVAIGDFLLDALRSAPGPFGDIGNWTAGALEDGVEFIGDVAHGAGDAAEDAIDAVGDAAEDVADAVGDAADAAGDVISSVADW